VCSVRAMVGNTEHTFMGMCMFNYPVSEVGSVTTVLYAAAQKNCHFKTCIVQMTRNVTNGENK
jgi:hypothetical protein